MNMSLDCFLEEERNGVIFCKIGKSSKLTEGIGGYFPYRDYVGEMIYLQNDTITFERLDDAINYLHYGDDLVIFSFEQGKDKMPFEGQITNGTKKNCYQTSCIFVKEVMSFKEVSTIDFVYNHLLDKNNFYDSSNLIIGYLNRHGFEKSALRCKELSDKNKENKDTIVDNAEEKKWLDCLIERIKRIFLNY